MRGPTAASLCSPYRGTLKHMPSLYCSLRIAGISKREEELVPNIDYSTSNFAALSQYFFVALKALYCILGIDGKASLLSWKKNFVLILQLLTSRKTYCIVNTLLKIIQFILHISQGRLEILQKVQRI